MHAHEIVVLCGIVAAGFVCQWIAWRVRLPAILFLLLTGIAIGPVFGLLQPDELLGDLLLPIVSIAVAIILFEGSLTLKFSEIRGRGAVVRNLVSVGVLITWIASAAAAYYLFGWDIYLSALFGAIVTVSGPTVVMPLLRTVRPVSSVASILRWEAILIDPLGAILGLLVFDVIIATQSSEGLSHVLLLVGILVATGLVLGVLGGYLFGMAIRHRVIPDFLRNYAGLAALLTVFAAAEAIRGESGLLAVTVMGVWLANMRDVELDDVLNFKESLTLVLVAALFIVLAARLNITALQQLGWGAVVLLLLLQFVVGPMRAFVSSIGSPLNTREMLFLGWVFPRGIVAAAISALFALRLEQIGYADADGLVPAVFAVIIGTVVIQSVSTKFVARTLGVAEPAPTGVLIIGANPFGIATAKALSDCGVSVQVADSHWASIREARMIGIPTFYGSAVSSYAEDNLEMTGLGNLLAASRSPGLNELACVRFTEEFGRNHVFTLSTEDEGEHEKHKVSGEQRGRVLFGGEHSLGDILRRLAAGDELKTTQLTDEFGVDDFAARYEGSWLLFVIDPDGHVHFSAADQGFKPSTGWTVAALVSESPEDYTEDSTADTVD